MKKVFKTILPIILITAITMAAIGGFAATTEGTTVSASGEVNISVAPDLAHVNLGVTTTNRDVEAARKQNSTAMDAVVEALKKSGVAANDIQTSNVSIYPTYDYTAGSQEITGYQVSNQVTATVRDLAKLAEVVNSSLKAGANQINGISFDLQDRDTVYNKALTDATKKAISKAKVLAEAADLKLGNLINVSESGNNYSPYSQSSVYMDTGAAAKAESSNIGDTIQVGQIQINASASVTYAASK